MTHYRAMQQKLAGDVPDYTQFYYDDHRVNDRKQLRLPHREGQGGEEDE